MIEESEVTQEDCTVITHLMICFQCFPGPYNSFPSFFIASQLYFFSSFNWKALKMWIFLNERKERRATELIGFFLISTTKYYLR